MTETKNMVVKEKNGKKVYFLKVLEGKNKGKIIRFYYIRKKDGVIGGKSIEDKKIILVGKGSVCEEFRKEMGLEMKKGRSSTDYSDILNEMK